MLRIYNSTTSSDLKSYFKQSFAREGYYDKDVEVVGKWGGKLAKDFGLKGDVEQADFYKLVDHINPKTGEQLTARKSANRRVGYDLTFNAPKSVSLAYTVTQDEKIMDAFTSAVRDTMEELEQEARTRVRKNGKNELRTTGKMVWSEFIHLTSRPEKDKKGVVQIDPHLHAHAYAFNVTWDKKEKAYKALENSGIKMNASYYEAAFHSRLAMNLKDAGYSIDRNGRYMELAGIDREMIEAFSNRGNRIKEIAKEKGLTDKQKDMLAARTRRGKDAHVPFQDLRENVISRFSDEQLTKIKNVKSANPDHQPHDVSTALNLSLAHELERRSVVREKRILAEALQKGFGRFTPKDILKEAKRHSQIIRRLVDGEVHATSKQAIKEEIKMIEFAREGKGKLDPIWGQPHEFSRDFLNDEQRRAVEHVLKSNDRVTLLEGGAGTGKTTLMKEVDEGMKKGGKKLFAFAPSAAASRGVLKEEGFKNADTVASLVASKKMQEKVRGQVIWIDEAGQVGTPTLNKVFEIAEKQNARVLLTGDTKQHSSVERGDAMRLLQERAGLKVATVREIQRQKVASYKDAVNHLQHGRISQGIETLDRTGNLIQVENKEQRQEMIADDYIKALEKKETALVVSPTRKEGAEVTRAIREKLTEKGKLGKQAREFTVQRNLDFTEAQKADINSYREGMVIQLMQNAKGFKAGHKFEVVGVEKGKLLVKGMSQRKSILGGLPLDGSAKFQVFEKGTLNVAEGERIRITNNGKSKDGKRLYNGNEYQVKRFDQDGNIVLTNGTVLDKDHRNFSYGYTSTSHSSQGKTVDRVLIAQGAQSIPASSREQFYVSVSRGRKSATIYTDDKEMLKSAVQKTQERVSALELKERSQPIKNKAMEVFSSGREKMQQMMEKARMMAMRNKQIGIARNQGMSR